ncbi:hypothetical protein L3Y34_019217 [Caenorhabditis briggsae]|uniref:One cut domain family member n=1 Tax=Caenorhabditis briggsae TaxID=6238 RepID=A0AAE9DPA8_CAEBR|nr:hypothetical protein L3Y34_019217 [Caenorhabditis briggsae]
MKQWVRDTNSQPDQDFLDNKKHLKWDHLAVKRDLLGHFLMMCRVRRLRRKATKQRKSSKLPLPSTPGQLKNIRGLQKRVVNRSQGTLSVILNKPEPWSFIGPGRQAFVRLYNWINLPEKKRLEIVDKNTIWDVPEKKENKCDNRKRKSTDEPSTTKRARTEFTNVQRQVLEALYEQTDRPTADEIQTIAEKLDLDETTVSNYFQNTRTRNKAKAD